MAYGLRVSLVVLDALTAGVLSGCSDKIPEEQMANKTRCGPPVGSLRKERATAKTKSVPET
ncbi:hypothetical protein GCM10010520_18220 [Rhizobium viscosum]